jgi:hypothetical protein
VGLGCQWRAQARGDGPLGPREGEGCAQERERERGGDVWAGSGPAEGGFPFIFLYLLFISYILYFFISFSFEQINS